MLVFQLFRYSTKTGSAFYVPVLRSWLVASVLINLQQISDCKSASEPKFTAYQKLGKKAEKKRYLFTRPTRKWTCSDENMSARIILCIRWSVNPQGLRGSIKMPAKTSVIQPLLF